ncbi:DegT/DnrJ/EryC1/StrS family aminotransferase [Fodinicola acaciae]|uniref:DegT/DnrJ/EryC1/StrS family aminotransferase n=1 Tax=Fodinicola acaciae TaxID=2681555 RepID=UPI0013D059F9|nr:DegT/DnrJ/EryC1/StrS family aminotransferase [Fodinicola acaciae]
MRNYPTVEDHTGRTIGAEEIEAATRVLRSGHLTRVGGTEAAALEREFATLIGAEHAVASSSGSAAVHLAVAAVDPEPGDEIIVPPLTDFGTVLGVLAANAVPVFADVDPLTGCLTAKSVAACLTDRTRAVIVVHLFGCPADIDGIRQVCDPRDVPVIEDCAQAYLTRPAGGGYAGTRSLIGCFSLQQSKHITAGEGGLTVTDDERLARRMRLLADKGWPRDTGERNHLLLGLNYRMPELSAAVARAQLAKLAGSVERRREVAAALTDQLRDLPGLLLPPDQGHSYFLYPIVLDTAVTGFEHREYVGRLAGSGAPVGAGYLSRPLYRTTVLTERRTYGTSGFPLISPPARQNHDYAAVSCPVAEDLIERSLVIALINERFDDEDTAALAQVLAEAYKR